MKQKNSLSKRLFYLRNELNLSVVESCGTYLIAAVASPVREENKIKFLSCKGLIPLGNMVFDTSTDSYVVDCVDVLHVGTVPISLNATIEGCPHWMSTVPLPERIIKKHLDPTQSKEVEKFFSIFSDSFSKFYIQMLDPNPCS